MRNYEEPLKLSGSTWGVLVCLAGALAVILYALGAKWFGWPI